MPELTPEPDSTGVENKKKSHFLFLLVNFIIEFEKYQI
jgi:hypothetical protein